MRVSIVIPIYNERQNIPILHSELTGVLGELGKPYEIIFVNDGSRDGSTEVLENIARTDARTKVIDFVHNFGQTAAMAAGIQAARGEIIIPMDGDLQNDPADIPRFLEKIDEGFDVVSGWRKDRKDGLVLRKIPSWSANWIIGFMTGLDLHDFGCSMKAYRREVIQGVRLYGEMHRFIAAYASWHGGRVTEIEVNHRPRVHGETKYGISRTVRVILDLVVVKFLSKYFDRPIHFFGGLGFVSLGGGVLAGLLATIWKVVGYKSFVETPLPVFSALLVIVGVQMIAIGVISEMLMRTYYESQDKTPYKIKRSLNFPKTK